MEGRGSRGVSYMPLPSKDSYFKAFKAQRHCYKRLLGHFDAKGKGSLQGSAGFRVSSSSSRQKTGRFLGPSPQQLSLKPSATNPEP